MREEKSATDVTSHKTSVRCGENFHDLLMKVMGRHEHKFIIDMDPEKGTREKRAKMFIELIKRTIDEQLRAKIDMNLVNPKLIEPEGINKGNKINIEQNSRCLGYKHGEWLIFDGATPHSLT